MKHFILFLFLLSPVVADAQIWAEDFDGGNASGAQPVITNPCYNDGKDYIGVVCDDLATCTDTIAPLLFSYSNVDGSFFGVRDMDQAPCAGDQLNGETLSFSGIDISSCGEGSVTYVCFSVAESRNVAGGESLSGGGDDTWDGGSSVSLTASVNGAAASQVTAIEAIVGSNSRPGIDVNCDGKSDDAGEPELTSTFTSYCFELPSLGTTLDLEFFYKELNTQGEDIAIDDIEVHCSDAVGTGLPGTLLDACTPFDPNVNTGFDYSVCLFNEEFNSASTQAVMGGICAYLNNNDYFGIVCNDGECATDINGDRYEYTNARGEFFGARDIDNACDLASNSPETFGTMSILGIDISAAVGQAYVCMDITESQGPEEVFNSGSLDAWDSNSKIEIYTTIDGSRILLTSLQSSGNSATQPTPGFDTDCDDSNADGPFLTANTFVNFCFPLLSAGDDLDIEFVITQLDNGGKDIAIDNVSVCATNNTATLPGTVLTACNIAPNICMFTEDFDGANITATTSVDCGRINTRDYLAIVCNDGDCSNDVNADYVYASSGATPVGQFLGARDIDNACGGTAFGTASISGIDISGTSAQVYVCMDIAESQGSTEVFNDLSPDNWNGDSQVDIFTTIDGTEVLLTSLKSSGDEVTQPTPGFDTDCDRSNADGPFLTANTFVNFCFPVFTTGNNLDIVIEITELDNGGKDIAIDNISVCETSDVGALPGQVLTACNVTRPLPVEFTHFRGEVTPKGTSILSWETALEVDSDYFDLEYSTNGETFSPLTRVEGQGTTNTATGYSYEHKALLAEMNYYRLKQVDFDGVFTYSNVIALRQNMSEMESLVYPNPARDVVVYVGAEAMLTVFDAYGKQIRQIQTRTGSETIDVSDLRSGAYLIEIIKGDNSRELKRFIKL